MSTTTPAQFTPLSILAGAIQLDSLIISRDAMPGHFIARAVILDLQPSQMVAAIMATEDRIKATYPRARRTGWSATSDGLRIYFYSWQPSPTSTRVGECVVCGAPVAAHFDGSNRAIGCAAASRRAS